MKKFEYCIQLMPPIEAANHPQQAVAYLNGYGHNGWELVTLISVANDADLCIFKKERV